MIYYTPDEWAASLVEQKVDLKSEVAVNDHLLRLAKESTLLVQFKKPQKPTATQPVASVRPDPTETMENIFKQGLHDHPVTLTKAEEALAHESIVGPSPLWSSLSPLLPSSSSFLQDEDNPISVLETKGTEDEEL